MDTKENSPCGVPLENCDVPNHSDILSPERTPNFYGLVVTDTPSPSSRDYVDKNSETMESDQLETMESKHLVSNPEMPQELIDQQLLDADVIENTVYNKCWVLSVLLKFVKYIQDKKELEKVELDETFHDDLCKLWDISVNEDVAAFLEKNEYLDIFCACVENSSSPRAIEISVGILANMACCETVCNCIELKPGVRRLIICLLQSDHPPTLVETSRLLITCVLKSSNIEKWTEDIKQSPDVHQSILFIFQSSTNATLLKNMAEFVDKVMESDDEICLKWSNSNLVGAVMEALVQLDSDVGQSIETFLHILQYVSTSENGAEALVEHAEKACQFSLFYLKSICDEDFIFINGKEGIIGSALSVLNVAFGFWKENKNFIKRDCTMVRCLLKLLEVVLEPKHESISDTDETSDALETSLIDYLCELLFTLLRDTLALLLQVSLENLQEETDEALHSPKCLDYLESSCNANRLWLFFRSIGSVELWLNIANRYKCCRLIEFLSSASKVSNDHVE